MAWQRGVAPGPRPRHVLTERRRARRSTCRSRSKLSSQRAQRLAHVAVEALEIRPVDLPVYLHPNAPALGRLHLARRAQEPGGAPVLLIARNDLGFGEHSAFGSRRCSRTVHRPMQQVRRLARTRAAEPRRVIAPPNRSCSTSRIIHPRHSGWSGRVQVGAKPASEPVARCIQASCSGLGSSARGCARWTAGGWVRAPTRASSPARGEGQGHLTDRSSNLCSLSSLCSGSPCVRVGFLGCL